MSKSLSSLSARHAVAAFVALVLLSSLGSGRAEAQVRIATVDVARVLNESREAKSKRAELDAKGVEAKKRIDAKNQALKSLETKLKTSKATEDSKEYQSYRTQARDLERLAKDTKQDLEEQFLKMNRSLTERALAIVKKYAEENRIDLVLDKSAAYRGPVLFGTQAADVTDQIVKRLDG